MVRACSKCRRLFPTGETACSDDGAPLVPVSLTDLPAALADRFAHSQLFARGATGTLYRVGTEGRVLKLFDREPLGSDDDVAQLERELARQPTVLEQGRQGPLLWVLRELAPGESLAARLERVRVLPLWEALAIAAQVATQLEELHSAGLLQREVKPGHVVLGAGAVPVAQLIDTGVARRDLLDEHAAPEVRAGAAHSARSDLYGLGKLLHAMLSGASTAPLDLPQPLAQLTAALLETDPHARPLSARQVRRALEPFLPRPMPDAERVARSRSSQPPSSRTGARTMSDKTQEITLEELESADPKDAPTQEIDNTDIEAAIAASTQKSAEGPVRSQSLPAAASIRQRLATRATSSAPPPPPSPSEAAPAKRPISSRPAPPPEALAHRTPLPPKSPSGSIPPLSAAVKKPVVPSRKTTEMGMPAVKPADLVGAGAASRSIPPRSIPAPPRVPTSKSSPPPSIPAPAAKSIPAPKPVAARPFVSKTMAGGMQAVASKPAPAAAAPSEAKLPATAPTFKDAESAAASGAKATEAAAGGGVKVAESAVGSGVKVAESAAVSGVKGSESAVGSGAKGAEPAAVSGAKVSESAAVSGVKVSESAAVSGVKGTEAPASAPATSTGVTAEAVNAAAASSAKATEPVRETSPLAAAAQSLASATEAAPVAPAGETAPQPSAEKSPASETLAAASASSLELAPASTADTGESAAAEAAQTSPGTVAAARKTGATAPDARLRRGTVAGPAVAPAPADAADLSPPLAASEAAPAEVPPVSAPRAFDVESLFDDKLEPERPAIAGATDATNPKIPLGTTGSGAPASYHPPRQPFLQSWPLLAAAGVLAMTVVGLSARACNSSDQQVASATPKASPPAAVAAPEPLPAAAEPPPAAAEPPPSAAPAEPAPAEPAPTAAAEPAADGDAKLEEEKALAANETPGQGRTLTAAQARPVPLSSRGGVVAYRPGDEPDVDYKARGRSFFSTGKYREAADAYERASQRTPSDAGAFAGLGASWLAAGQTDRAISAYQRALQLKPDVSGFQAALGRAYLQKGDRGRASAAYRKAIELDPQNSAAQRGLQSIQ